MKLYFKILPVCLLMNLGHAAAQNIGGRLVGYAIGSAVKGLNSGHQRFEVTLKNDSVVKFTMSEIYIVDKKCYLEGKKDGFQSTVFPEQTKSIARLTSKGKIAGFPTDSCWLFLVKPGRINCYSKLPISGRDNFVAIQQGNGEVVALTRKNLMAMISIDEKEVFLWLDRGELIKAVNRANK